MLKTSQPLQHLAYVFSTPHPPTPARFYTSCCLIMWNCKGLYIMNLHKNTHDNEVEGKIHI